MKIETIYDIGNKVTIDGDQSIVGLILAINVSGVGLNVTYQVGWMHCGQSYSAWIEEWRLDVWEG